MKKIYYLILAACLFSCEESLPQYTKHEFRLMLKEAYYPSKVEQLLEVESGPNLNYGVYLITDSADNKLLHLYNSFEKKDVIRKL